MVSDAVRASNREGEALYSIQRPGRRVRGRTSILRRSRWRVASRERISRANSTTSAASGKCPVRSLSFRVTKPPSRRSTTRSGIVRPAGADKQMPPNARAFRLLWIVARLGGGLTFNHTSVPMRKGGVKRLRAGLRRPGICSPRARVPLPSGRPVCRPASRHLVSERSRANLRQRKSTCRFACPGACRFAHPFALRSRALPTSPRMTA